MPLKFFSHDGPEVPDYVVRFAYLQFLESNDLLACPLNDATGEHPDFGILMFAATKLAAGGRLEPAEFGAELLDAIMEFLADYRLQYA